MLKGLTRLWLRGVKQTTKAQTRQQKKWVKALLNVPVAKSPPKKATSRKLTTRKPATARPETRSLPVRLPGKWLAGFYSSFPDKGVLPARRLAYRLYLPHAASMLPQPLPLVVMLHGCEQTAEEFARGTRFNQLAEDKGFAVLYPQQSLRGHPNRCWQWYDKATQEGAGDVEVIAGMIEEFVQKYGMDRTRIYIAGLSAGASMASIVALNYPHLIAAVGMHSGTIFGAGHSRMGAYSVMQAGASRQMRSAIQNVMNPVEAFARMPAILIHGQEDKVVRPVNLAQAAFQFKILNRLTTAGEKPVVIKPGGKPGSKNPAHPYKIYDHYAGRKLMLRVCDIAGLDHAWSGGDATLRFNSGAGPDATKLIWNFFSRHRRLA
jgi:poly(hydroxyalkanoate) depolymerase family esterase